MTLKTLAIQVTAEFQKQCGRAPRWIVAVEQVAQRVRDLPPQHYWHQ